MWWATMWSTTAATICRGIRLRPTEDTISTVAAFSYEINWDGSVSGQAYQGLLKEAKAAGKPVLALVHNISASGGFDRNLVQAVLSNPSLRQTAVVNIARTVRDNGYAGVNVDFEDVPTYNRDLYTAFVRELAAVLQKDGYQVTLSVPAKTWDDPNNAWSGAFDYQALGKIADAIMIMTYDEHWRRRFSRSGGVHRLGKTGGAVCH